MTSEQYDHSCAACGKVDSALKSCNACKLVKYCGVDCQVAHRSKHKKACKKRATELFDEKLFEMPPRRKDCVICYVQLPLIDETVHQSCCGKIICFGCVHSMTRNVCPFCNAPPPKNVEELNGRIFERIEKYNDPMAMDLLAEVYDNGLNGFTLDHSKAVELYQRAAHLGFAPSHYNLANSYYTGEGVQLDRKKAVYHCQVAARKGYERARYNLGCAEKSDGNDERAMRHHIIAAKCGHDDSLDKVKEGYMEGLVTKDAFEVTLRAHKASHDEIKTEQRDRARAYKKYVDSVC